MKKDDLKFCLIVILTGIVMWISFVLLVVYVIDPMDAPDSHQDNTVVLLHKDADTMQEIYSAITDLMYERGMQAIKLNRVFAIFTGEQIKSQKGEWEYHLTGDDGKARHFASIRVTVDMETHAVTSVYTFYDDRTRSRRLKNGYLEDWDLLRNLDISQWRLATDEVFELIYEREGNDAFSKFIDFQLELICYWEEQWRLDIIQEGDSLYAKTQTIATFDPVHKKIIEVEENWKGATP